jgi:hypothetical protein
MQTETFRRQLQDRGALGARVDHHCHALAVDLAVDQRLAFDHSDLEFNELVEFTLGLRRQRRGCNPEHEADSPKTCNSAHFRPPRNPCSTCTN